MTESELVAVEAFEKAFGETPEIVCTAPGRVNLIGEHTDYNDGFVFPAAIDRGLTIAARVSRSGESRLASVQLGAGNAFSAATCVPGEVTGWAAYAAGMSWALRTDSSNLPDLEAVLHSTVPIGSGVSSSAALEVGFGVLWNSLAGLGLTNKQIALLAQRCENKFVGVNSGIMDQMASAMGKEGKAMFLDTRGLDIEYAAIPSDLALVLCDTKKPRALTDSAYNERRSQCEEAAALLGKTKLRDANLEELEAAKGAMDPVVYRRAKHVITENQRCIDFRIALNAGDRATAGALMRGSHESLRDDYEVSCAELDIMAEAAWAAPGCVGARMTGAGFGGACIALVEQELVGRFMEATLTEYARRSQLKGDALVALAAEGAHLVTG